MKINRQLSFLLIILFISCQPPKPPAERDHGFSEERLSRYEAFVQKEIDDGKLPGFVSLIKRNGLTAHNVALGYRNVDTKEPMTTRDIFYIQSMTKPIITVAFMMLFEEGHFALNDPVSMYLPEFKDRMVALSPWEQDIDGPTEPANKDITIAHLLSHTAGLSHGLFGTPLDRAYAEAMYEEEHATVEDRVTRMLDLPLIGHPGEQWYYSAAPDVLSVLIAKFSGMSTAEFLQTRLFDPLGMDDTGYNVTPGEQDRIVKVHTIDSTGALRPTGGFLGGDQYEGNTIHSGVNALFSTASDYMKFAQMMLNKGELDGTRYLGRKTVELMTLNHIGDLYPWGEGFGFGLGFSVVTDVAGTKALNTEGTHAWSGAYSTYFFIDPKEELVAVFMTQLDPFSNYYEQKFRHFVYAAIND